MNVIHVNGNQNDADYMNKDPQSRNCLYVICWYVGQKMKKNVARGDVGVSAVCPWTEGKVVRVSADRKCVAIALARIQKNWRVPSFAI